ncbi:hypothetical protein QQ045_009165 [Rhodiola kirilowii]
MEIFRSGLTMDGHALELRWSKSATGQYSVKTGYMMAKDWVDAKRRSVGGSSNADNDCPVWRNSGKSVYCITERIKVMVWRLFHDSLPVAANLLRKRVCETQIVCCFCGWGNETVKHLFLDCWWAMCLWTKLAIEAWPADREGSVTDWLWFHMTENSLVNLKKVLVGAWTL